MVTKYLIPSPEAFARLQKNPHLAGPDTQAALRAYAAGEIGIETTVYRALLAVQQHHPALQKALDAAAAERATRAREEQEMSDNVTATEPTFIEYGLDGKPLTKSEPPAVTEPAGSPPVAPTTTAATAPLSGPLGDGLATELEAKIPTRQPDQEAAESDDGFLAPQEDE